MIPFFSLRLQHFTAAVAIAAGGALPARAQMALKGDLLLAEDFRTHAEFTKEKVRLKDGWTARVAHGTWQRSAEGVEVTWATGHQPVLVVEGDFGDAIIELEFRYRAEPDYRWAACRISPTNQVLNPRAYAASLWANIDYKSRAVGLVLEHDEWSPGHITQVNRKMTEFKPDTWHLLRMELVGDKVLATGGGVTVYGTYDKFALPKSSLWLATGLSKHELRRLRIYVARPGPKWTAPKHRAAAVVEPAPAAAPAKR